MKDKTSSAVGLDLGSYAIKCVEISRNNDKMTLERVSILPVPDQLPDNVFKTLKVLIQTMPSPPKHVRISVSGSSLLIRRIALPLMTPAELKGAIRFEAEGHIPFNIEDCILDFQMLNQDAEKKTMNVLLVAAKRELILERIKMLADAGINPEIIDLDIFCLINAFEVLGNAQNEKVYGVLNIGHRVSSFAIIQDTRPFFVREIAFGGQNVTKELAGLRGIPEAEADELKMNPTNDIEIQEVLKNATHKGFEMLAEELRHSIDYFENETGEDLKNIWISGGGAKSFNAPATLSEELGKNVSLWNNIKKMEIFGTLDMKYLEEHSPQLNVAFGMVIRGIGARR